MYFLALYLKKHIELILLCCVYSAININSGRAVGVEIKRGTLAYTTDKH